MKFNVTDLIGLISSLSPFVPAAVVTVETVIGALKGAGALTDEDVDADFTALIAQAIEAKAEADRAASGNDPQ